MKTLLKLKTKIYQSPEKPDSFRIFFGEGLKSFSIDIPKYYSVYFKEGKLVDEIWIELHNTDDDYKNIISLIPKKMLVNLINFDIRGNYGTGSIGMRPPPPPPPPAKAKKTEINILIESDANNRVSRFAAANA